MLEEVLQKSSAQRKTQLQYILHQLNQEPASQEGEGLEPASQEGEGLGLEDSEDEGQEDDEDDEVGTRC